MTEWKPVPQYEGLYEISDAGMVRNCRTQRLLKVQKNCQTNYLQVFLWRNNKQKTASVHRILFEAFVAPLKPGEIVRHLNDVKADNRLENLAAGSHSDNRKDAARNGSQPRGETTWCAKLTEEQAKRIKYQGENSRVLARELGVSEWTVYSVRQGKSWRHV